MSNKQISRRVVFKACRVSYSIHSFDDFSVMLCTLQARVSTSEDNHLKLKKERQDAIMAQFRAKYVCHLYESLDIDSNVQSRVFLTSARILQYLMVIAYMS